MWKSAYVGVYQLLNWKMHGETLKYELLRICGLINNYGRTSGYMTLHDAMINE